MTSPQIFKRVIKQSLKPTNEKVLLIGDEGIGPNKASVFLTQGYAMACEELGLEHEVIHQATKERGEESDPEVIKKIKSLPKENIVMVNVSNRIGSMESLGHSFRSYLSSKGHRFTSASSLGTISPQNLPVLCQSLDIDYKEIKKRSMAVKKALDNGSEAHLKSKGGTDIVFGIEGMTARSAHGMYHEPGTGGNLPGSEAYIAPKGKQVNGVVVIDGSARLKEGTKLITSKAGIKMTVENGSIVQMNKSPEAKLLENTLAWAHKNSEFPWGVRRIGELGIGTNPQAEIIGATIVDEKVKGSAHVAIGSNKWFGGSITSIIHLDQVMRNATVRIDGRRIKP